jgi:hypothetical protein
VVEALPSVVRPVTFNVEVAVRAPPKNAVPELYELPCTLKRFDGEVVPMPMEPSEDMKMVEVAWAVPASFPTRKLPLARALETGVKPKRDEVAANARALPVAFE